MKYKIRFAHILVCLFAIAICYSFTAAVKINQSSITGAWKLNDGTRDHILIFADGYIAHAAFNSGDKSFTNTRGGTYQLQNGSLQVKWEYNSDNNEKVGQQEDFAFKLNGKELTVVADGQDITLTRIDEGTGELAGNWRITGRMQDGKRNPMNTQSARKTLKILSGSRFQWIAINPETKEFFGTGGGNYTFKNGKYTENIEFFPRDSSRVGASLGFDDKVVNGEWHHTGMSSKGDKLYEIWSRVPNNSGEKK